MSDKKKKLPARIICYGDSNTYGYDPRDRGRYGSEIRWPEAMGAWLRDQGLDCQTVNEGMNGRAVDLRGLTDPVMPDPDGFFAHMLLRDAPCALVVIMMGSNNLNGLGGVDRVAMGIRRYLVTGRSLAVWSGEPRFLLLSTPYTTGEGFSGSGEQLVRIMAEEKELTKALRQLSVEMDCGFLDVNQFASAEGYDRSHLTEEGHLALARGIGARVLDMLG